MKGNGTCLRRDLSSFPSRFKSYSGKEYERCQSKENEPRLGGEFVAGCPGVAAEGVEVATEAGMALCQGGKVSRIRFAESHL